jgi:hypothetical protein
MVAAQRDPDADHDGLAHARRQLVFLVGNSRSVATYRAGLVATSKAWAFTAWVVAVGLIYVWMMVQSVR